MTLTLLLIALGAIAWFLKGHLGAYRRLKTLSDTASRQRRYRLWIAKAILAFAVPALAGLALLNRLDALTAVPPDFAAARALLPAFAGGPSAFLTGAVGGAAVGGLVVGTLAAIRRKRTLPVGNVGALLPRNRPEVAHAAAMSVAAGITEELAFRLYIPLLVTLATGNAILAFAFATLLFGAMHLYQGWKGVAATTIVGATMTAVYLMTGAVWLAMLLHALIDLNGLVVRPLLSSSSASRS
ncbi:CPBP family intramembrane glutamic endopeptidase [Sphingomonas sp. R86521]|uniref:CPBP family intramembrane glutamic endopeptidase n=1 Tax=Sphingomonas sp. R86521 TaxID=3093860 RepID=UPI0036D3F5D8